MNRARNVGQRIIWNQIPVKPTESLSCAASKQFSSLSTRNKQVNEHELSRYQTLSWQLPGCRFVSTGSEQQSSDENKPKQRFLPKLMNTDIVVSPPLFSFFIVTFKAIKIRNTLDSEFALDDFIDGSRKAIESVSDKLASADFDGLRGFVTDDVIDNIRDVVLSMTNEQRSHLRTMESDIVRHFLSSIDIREEGDQTFVDIFTICQAIQGYNELRSQYDNVTPLQFFKKAEHFIDDNFYVLNYKFTKVYSKHSSDDWIVSYLNHANITDEMNDQMKMFTKEFEDFKKREKK